MAQEATKEKLLLRKGLHADLINPSKCPIIPGAISITTDEPGIYIDLAKDNNHDGDYRVRIGDVIVVPSLTALLESTATDAQKFSENALYYASDKNVLCKYDKEEGKFVWINDPTPLQTQIDNITNNLIGGINTQLITINSNITNIQTDLGTRATNHAATKGKTVFQAIEDEYVRAADVEKGLQDQITAIVGEGEGSIGALEKALAAEVSARQVADQTINDTITSIYGGAVPSTGIVTITGNASDIKDLVDKIGSVKDTTDDTVYGAIAVETARATQAEKDLEKTITDLKNGSTSTIKSLDNKISALEQADVTINASIGSSTDSREASTVYGAIAQEAYDREQADIALENTLKQYVNDNLAAADAMTFKDTVSYKDGSSTELNLPTTGVKGGDTYVVAANLFGTDHPYHAGDMLIAKRDQKSDEQTYGGGWQHVKTGYEAIHESKMTVENNTVKLTSHVGADLGQVTFATDATSNVAVSTANNTVSINLVWATF